MKTFLFVVMSVIVSVNAYANSNWVYINTSTEGDVFFIDNNSIQKSSDSITFWRRTNYRQRDQFGDLSSKIQDTINCRTREIISRYYMFYDDINNAGTMTTSSAKKSSWEPIAPDTVSWRWFEHVCK